MAEKCINLLLLAIALHIPSYVLSTTWYVHPDSGLNSIQAGLDCCGEYDTVLVGPGIYFEIIDWPYLHGINLVSEYGPDTTIIDAQKTGSVIYLSLMPDDSVTLIRGFTLKNGSTWQGGGIYSVGGRPTIRGNVITRCTCQWPAGQSDGPPPRGGGIYTEWSSPLIIDNIVTGNTADEGGGLSCLCDASNIAPQIIGNTITLNSAHIGGGVQIIHPFTMTIVRENTISCNTANYGGGIACYYVFNPLLTIARNEIIGNSADSAGGGIWCYINSNPYIDSCVITKNINDGVYSGFYSTPVIRYNNITNNAGYGVRNVDQSLVVSAENNWWGHTSGPYNPLTNPGGLGDTVSHYVDYDPWLTSPGTQELISNQPSVVSLYVSPNPFHRKTRIRYSMLDTRYLIPNPVISIYNAIGRLIKSFNLEFSIQNPESDVVWDGKDNSGRQLPGGIYFLRLEGGDYAGTKKIIFLK